MQVLCHHDANDSKREMFYEVTQLAELVHYICSPLSNKYLIVVLMSKLNYVSIHRIFCPPTGPEKQLYPV